MTRSDFYWDGPRRFRLPPADTSNLRVEANPRNKAAELALEIYCGALADVRGDRLVREHVSLSGQHLIVDEQSYNLSEFDKVIVAGAGKASPAMAQGLEQILGPRIHDGLIITKHGHTEPLEYCQTIEASHPIPSDDSILAGEEMLRFAERYSGPKNLVLFVLSGGASALMESPVEWVTLEDLQLVNRLLLGCGATIMTINSIRSKFSKIKMGGLARAFGSATVAVLALSDVGPNTGAIGSGPFIHVHHDLNLEKLARDYKIADRLPAHLIARLSSIPHPVGELITPMHWVIGDIQSVVYSAYSRAVSLGLQVLRPAGFYGEARDVVHSFGKPAYESSYDKGRWPELSNQCMFAFGEPVVTDLGIGLGGRAQEAACSISQRIAGDPGIAVLIAGTDGTDGPTDAAGALVDGTTEERANQAGFAVETTLSKNDSYHFHEAAGTLIKTGPTGTNLNDIVIVVKAD